MPNTKPVGVAYSDPALSGATLDASVFGASGGTAGFFGATPVTRPTALSTVDLNTLTTTAISYLSTTQISALQTSVNGLITKIQTLGLTA